MVPHRRHASVAFKRAGQVPASGAWWRPAGQRAAAVAPALAARDARIAWAAATMEVAETAAGTWTLVVTAAAGVAYV